MLAPGKQSASTLMSSMLLKDGLPYAVYGSQGGEVQPQAQTAFVTRLVDFGFDVQAALEAPRLLYGRSWGDDARLLLEATAPDLVFAGCAAAAPRRAGDLALPAHGHGAGDPPQGPWSTSTRAGRTRAGKESRSATDTAHN